MNFDICCAESLLLSTPYFDLLHNVEHASTDALLVTSIELDNEYLLWNCYQLYDCLKGQIMVSIRKWLFCQEII